MAEPGEIVIPPWAGAIPLGGGLMSIARIPLPGPGNLVLSLQPPKGWSSSTSTVFIMQGKYKGLRLDYGFNKKTNMVDYHWNRKSFGDRFPIPDHTPAGRAGAALYEGARAYRYLGESLVVIGVVVDVISIATASDPLRRSTQVVSAWAMAWAGTRAGGVAGAELGTLAEPGLGTAVGGIVLGIGGGIAGYWAGEKLAGEVYDWGKNTVFRPLPADAVPRDYLAVPGYAH